MGFDRGLLDFGTAVGWSRRNDQNSRSLAEISMTTGWLAWSARGLSYGAPALIQSLIWVMAVLVKGSAFAGIPGADLWRIFLSSKLFSASPGITAGPSCPPLSKPALVTMLKSDLTDSPPWHFRQFSSSTARTCPSNKASPAFIFSAWPDSAIAVFDTHRAHRLSHIERLFIIWFSLYSPFPTLSL